MGAGIPYKSAVRAVAVGLGLTVLSACGDSLAGIETLETAELDQDAPTLEVAATPPQQTGGLFASLFGANRGATVTEPSEESSEIAQTDAPAEGEGEAPEESLVVVSEAQEVETVRAAQPRQTGFLAGLFGGNTSKAQPAIAAASTQPLVVRTGLPAQDGETTAVAAPPPAKSDVPFGTKLPYGKVAKICGVPPRKLGKKAAQHPERRPQFVLYDSKPKSTDPRTFYISGFSDGCVRQFTASLAIFGTVGMHEQLRYGLPAEVQPYSDTDKAYEKIKRRICGVSRRKPCGSKITLLENDTVFLSIYERFDGNAQWMNLLLHRGAVVAEDLKEGVADS